MRPPETIKTRAVRLSPFSYSNSWSVRLARAASGWRMLIMAAEIVGRQEEAGLVAEEEQEEEEATEAIISRREHAARA